jgi:hypothetical protein
VCAVTLNLFQGLIRHSYHEMLKQVQHDKAFIRTVTVSAYLRQKNNICRSYKFRVPFHKKTGFAKRHELPGKSSAHYKGKAVEVSKKTGQFMLAISHLDML